MSSFFYFLKESLTGFTRNLSTALGSIVTIFLSLLIIGIFLVGGSVVNNVVKSVEQEVNITVWIADSASSSDVQSLQSDIKSMSSVANVTYTDKDQALENFKASSSSDIAESLDGQNPLPASIDVELSDPKMVEDVAAQIEANNTFQKICDNPSDPSDSLRYGEKTVDRLFQLTSYVRVIGVALVGLLIFIALVFINNTIRLAILARRKEIAIMRLVGASNGFIRGPFLMEGALHAIVGAALAIGTLEVLRNLALPKLQDALTWLPIDLSASTFVMFYVLLAVFGLVIGLIALFIINPEHALVDGFWRILQGGFYDFPYGCGKVLTQTAPLIMTGLSVAFAFKTGLFNIGAAGQYTLGAFGALYFAIVLGMPWWVCLLVSAVFGAVWGAIPGIFKAYLNINEVITSIMFNWIGLYLVNEIIYGRGSGVMYDAHNTRTWKLATNAPQAQIPSCGMSELFHTSNTTIAIFLAIIVAIVVWVVLEKTTFGYELKAVGLNKNAARYAGINEKKNVILSMTIAGALAGFGAGLFYLSGGGEWNPLNSTSLPAMGFNGIATALLANSNPIGTIFSSLFISHISVGGAYLPTKYFPSEIADLISGIIIYLCAFSMLFRTLFEKKLIHKKDTANANAEPAAKAVTKPEKEGK